jgi:uncharacterized coiled-coil DUF342 family protein
MSTPASQAMLIKRSITIKTLVTDEFRTKAKQELSQETQMMASQLDELETQFQQTLRQLEEAARQGHNVARQMDQLHQEVHQRRAQLQALGQELDSQLKNLDTMSNGGYITTGQLENFVELKVGDDIYKKMRSAELLVKDGIVTAILEG